MFTNKYCHIMYKSEYNAWLGHNGPEWFKLRTVFQRGLSNLNSVRTFLPASETIIQEWLDYLRSICSKDNLDYLAPLSRLFLELTCVSALDMRLNSFSKHELHTNSTSSRLIHSTMTTNSCILQTDNGPQFWRTYNTPMYKKLKRAQDYMEYVAVDLLTQKLTFYDESTTTNRTVSLLESYLSSPELDLKDILGMAVDFLLAGIDTTTYTCSFLFYHLANNPAAQNKLYDEVVELLSDTDSQVTKNTLANCPYARAVLKESFRLNPISVGIGRILDSDAVFSGYHVPKGTVVVSQNQISSRLEDYFRCAGSFMPERWLKSDAEYQAKAVHPFLVLPFGHGPRSCIARRLAEQNILTLLLKLVRNFRIGWRGGVLDSNSLLINKPDKPVTLTFTPRC